MKSGLLGQLGENIAREYLEKKGYNIIEQNYKTKYAEIDLVAKKDDVLIFVEVRSKTGEQFGSPEDTINREKKRRLKMNSKGYVYRVKWKEGYRIDAICIVFNPDQTVFRLTHHENIIQ